MHGQHLIILVLNVVFHSTSVLALEVNFRDSGYVTYTLSSAQSTAQDHILLLLRTIKPSGLLLHAAGRNGDFFTLEILRGKIR